jgi:hypothetical protein
LFCFVFLFDEKMENKNKNCDDDSLAKTKQKSD